MQEFYFTPVNLSSATATKIRSYCKYLQSLEIHNSAMDWIMLLRSKVLR